LSVDPAPRPCLAELLAQFISHAPPPVAAGTEALAHPGAAEIVA
jgi:hypothetical protein